MDKGVDFERLREMITRCQWKFAKTMPFAPHEYIVKDRCPLSKDEFEYFVNMQREHGVKERWGKYNNPYLYIDDYKYWTMGAPIEDTTVINRAKACVVNDVHQLYEGIQDMEMSYVDRYIHEKIGLKQDAKGFNIDLINGRLKEIADCEKHLERIRNNYACEIMKEWSQCLSEDFPDLTKCEDIGSGNIIYTGVSMPLDETPDAIAVRIQMENQSLYYGVTYMLETKEQRQELQERLDYVNKDGDFIKGSDWLYYKYTSYKDGYESLKQLVQKLVDHILFIIKDRDDAIRILREMDVDTEGKSIEEIDELIQSYLGLSFKEEPSLPDIDYDNIQLPPDTENTETHKGPTPHGGAYSTAYYYDEKHNPCKKDEAYYMNIVEYSVDGERVGEVYGLTGKASK